MRRSPGGVPERPKGTGCKPVGSAYGGSNPPAPTHPHALRGVVLRRQYRGAGLAEITPAPARAPSKAVLALGALVLVSVVVRVLVAWRHSIPRLFPDEYIYTALARSIGHGRLEIRGETAHFPGILEPILAAPLWRGFSSTTAYHLIQVENAIAASLAAIPIYLLARRLQLSSGYALASAACALLIPELVVIAYTSSDAIAYPLALAAVASAVFAIDEPRPRNQVAFLVFATLATAARVQYFVLVPAYIVAAAAIERRELWRRHRIAVIALAPVGVAFVIGSVRLLRSRAGHVVERQFREVVLPSGVPTCDRGRSCHRPGGGRGDSQTADEN